MQRLRWMFWSWSLKARFSFLCFFFINCLFVLRCQVMKMVMTLTVQQSGCLHFVKRPGAVLEPGSVVARIDLDDHSSIHRVSHYLLCQCKGSASLVDRKTFLELHSKTTLQQSLKQLKQMRTCFMMQQTNWNKTQNVSIQLTVLTCLPPPPVVGGAEHSRASAPAASAHRWRKTSPGVSQRAGKLG